jgi:hypothetical protein
MVMVPADQVAVTPGGRPLAPFTPSLFIPVAPVVVCEILVIAELMHEAALPGPVTVFIGFTVIVPVAFTVPQPPVRGIL